MHGLSSAFHYLLGDVGTHERQPFIVCELLEGETLRDRLLRGARARRA